MRFLFSSNIGLCLKRGPLRRVLVDDRATEGHDLFLIAVGGTDLEPDHIELVMNSLWFDPAPHIHPRLDLKLLFVAHIQLKNIGPFVERGSCRNSNL